MEIVGGFSPVRVGGPGAAASWKSRSVYFGYFLRLMCQKLACGRGLAALGGVGAREGGLIPQHLSLGPGRGQCRCSSLSLPPTPAGSSQRGPAYPLDPGHICTLGQRGVRPGEEPLKAQALPPSSFPPLPAQHMRVSSVSLDPGQTDLPPPPRGAPSWLPTPRDSACLSADLWAEPHTAGTQ